MTTMNATNARKRFYSLIKSVNKNHDPILINGKNGAAVIVSESDWNAISETLYLVSIPGMRESIKAGLKEPLKNCSKELNW